MSRVYHFGRMVGRVLTPLCEPRGYRRNTLAVEYSLSPAFRGARRLTPCEHCLHFASVTHSDARFEDRVDILGIATMDAAQRARFAAATKLWEERHRI